MICALPECDNEVPASTTGRPARFCSPRHTQRAHSRRHDALARGEILAPGEIPPLKQRADRVPRESNITRLTALLEEQGIPLEEIGSVKAVRFNQWTALAKGEMKVDAEGKKYREPTRVVDMESIGVVIHPSWSEGPKWPVIQPAPRVEVNVEPRAVNRIATGWKTALILPDTQFGFRRDIYTDELSSFHCERSLDCALQLAELLRPDLTVWLGDTLDFGPMSIKYLQEPGFQLTTQPAVDAAGTSIAMFHRLTAETRVLEGNHDRRLPNLLRAQAMAAYGLKRANSAPEEWPVLSVPNLLRLDELGVEYVGGYPAAATYINDNLACVHGSKLGNKSTSSASAVVDDERVSTIYGHVHRIETRFKTRNVRGGDKITQAVTPGCLCKIDGTVPSVKGAIDDFARSVRHFEDWQNGIAVVNYKEGDSVFDVNVRPIIDGRLLFDGELIESRV